MKKSTIIIIVVAVIAVIWGISGYNGLVSMDEGVQTKWADVETQYQRRADLIPNLVNTVKGYAAHESETLQAVVEARAKATSMNIDPSNMSAEQIANFQKAQDGVSSALSRLLVTVEKYPDLRPTRTSRNCRSSWRARRTASVWHAATITNLHASTTPPCAVSPRTSWPACSVSRRRPTSRLRRAVNRLPPCSSKEGPIT